MKENKSDNRIVSTSPGWSKCFTPVFFFCFFVVVCFFCVFLAGINHQISTLFRHTARLIHGSGSDSCWKYTDVS